MEQAIDEEMARLLKDGPTAEEVERASDADSRAVDPRARAIGGFGGKADSPGREATFAGDPAFYKVSLERMEKATPRSHTRRGAPLAIGGPSFTLEVQPFAERSAKAEGVDRSSGPPMPDSFPDVDFDDFERAFLENGMQLLVVERDAVPVVEFNLLFDAGFAADKYAKLGTANLVMQMLDEGTKKRSALEISDELRRPRRGVRRPAPTSTSRRSR